MSANCLEKMAFCQSLVEREKWGKAQTLIKPFPRFIPFGGSLDLVMLLSGRICQCKRAARSHGPSAEVESARTSSVKSTTPSWTSAMGITRIKKYLRRSQQARSRPHSAAKNIYISLFS